MRSIRAVPNDLDKESLVRFTVEHLLCPFCNTTNPTIRYKFENCAILRCQQCHLMWLYPKPEIGQLHEVYDGQYYFNQNFFKGDRSTLYGYADYLTERINKQYGYKKIVSNVKKLLLRGGMTADRFKCNWFDVGCGMGFLMDVAFDEGFCVSGAEFNPAAVEYIRSKYTFPVRHGVLSEMEFPEKHNVISMFDVIEHLYDPIGDLRKLRQAITDDGYLLIQTMDSDSLVSQLLGKRLEDFRRTREHLFFFSRDSIRLILQHCGWEVFEIHSIGHTFQLSFLIDRFSIYSPLLMRLLRSFVHPRWLLDANIYVNPGTKMLIYAKPQKVE